VARSAVSASPNRRTLPHLESGKKSLCAEKDFAASSTTTHHFVLPASCSSYYFTL